MNALFAPADDGERADAALARDDKPVKRPLLPESICARICLQRYLISGPSRCGGGLFFHPIMIASHGGEDHASSFADLLKRMIQETDVNITELRVYSERHAARAGLGHATNDLLHAEVLRRDMLQTVYDDLQQSGHS